jgi:hypothetical protein
VRISLGEGDDVLIGGPGLMSLTELREPTSSSSSLRRNPAGEPRGGGNPTAPDFNNENRTKKYV